IVRITPYGTAWVGTYLGLVSASEEAAGQLGSATFVLPLLRRPPTGGARYPSPLGEVPSYGPHNGVRHPDTAPVMSPTRDDGRCGVCGVRPRA
ncbi:hypothetical protein ACWD0G_19400, partial [Streptomyces goshikiensis]